jgi:hypothetical protein
VFKSISLGETPLISTELNNQNGCFTSPSDTYIKRQSAASTLCPEQKLIYNFVSKNDQTPRKDSRLFVNNFNTPFSPYNKSTPKSIKSDKLHGRSPLKESPTKRVHLDKNDSLSNVANSPPTQSTIFFSKLAKERKPVHAQNPIPFSMFISTTKVPIRLSFFKALDGIQPYLDQIIQEFKNSKSTIDYFETNYVLVKRLGHGSFADAFHVTSLEDSLDYAIKKQRQPFSGYKDA